MRNYNLRPEKLSSLDDLYPEQKYCLYALDSLLKDHKSKQLYLELSMHLRQAENADPLEFLPEPERKGTAFTDKEKLRLGTQMKADLIGKLKTRLEEL